MIRPRIIVHRCGGALAPENSLAGLRIAARLGCRGVEFDVMLSADGVPLLIHDETLDRTTTGTGRVCELTAAEIRAFDTGAPHHTAFAVSPAPTLAEALAVCDELGLWANIELKPAAGHDARTGELAGAWLARHWNGRGVISSFSPVALAAARRQGDRLPLALLYETLAPDWREAARALGCTRVHLAAATLTPETAAELSGMLWAAYTVNRPDEANGLFTLGCGGIFTDRPDLWPAEAM